MEPPASAVKASACVQSSAAVETAKAGLSSGSIASGNPSMIKPTEGAGVRSCRCVRVIGPTKALMPSVKTSTTGVSMIEVRSTRMNIIAIDDSLAMRDVRVVVVDDPPAFMAPIISPVMPTPAEAAK
jgi:hypothetical protein